MVSGVLTLTELITLSSSQLSDATEQGLPIPELAARHLAALGRRSSMRVSLKGHQERSQSCGVLGEEKASLETLKQNLWETKKDKALCFKIRTEFCYRTIVIYSNGSK